MVSKQQYAPVHDGSPLFHNATAQVQLSPKVLQSIGPHRQSPCSGQPPAAQQKPPLAFSVGEHFVSFPEAPGSTLEQ